MILRAARGGGGTGRRVTIIFPGASAGKARFLFILFTHQFLYYFFFFSAVPPSLLFFLLRPSGGLWRCCYNSLLLFF